MLEFQLAQFVFSPIKLLTGQLKVLELFKAFSVTFLCSLKNLLTLPKFALLSHASATQAFRYKTFELAVNPLIQW